MSMFTCDVYREQPELMYMDLYPFSVHFLICDVCRACLYSRRSGEKSTLLRHYNQISRPGDHCREEAEEWKQFFISVQKTGEAICFEQLTGRFICSWIKLMRGGLVRSITEFRKIGMVIIAAHEYISSLCILQWNTNFGKEIQTWISIFGIHFLAHPGPSLLTQLFSVTWGTVRAHYLMCHPHLVIWTELLSTSHVSFKPSCLPLLVK